MKSNCLSIVNNMAQEDQDALMEKLEQYQAMGIPPEKAQRMAASDTLEEIRAESIEFMRLVQEQHPDPVVEPEVPAALADEPSAADATEAPAEEDLDDAGDDVDYSVREQIRAGADAIKAMTEDERDNLEPAKAPGGWHAYVLFEARKLMPKPTDKLKKLTERNSFIAHQDNEYLANVDGVYYGINKWEDPDATGDEEEGSEPFVYAFGTLEDGGYNVINSMESGVPELMAAMRANNAKLQLSERQTETPAFKRWFGDSKVVDADGKPLVVYHGTNSIITEFDPKRAGSRDPGFFGKGFYFTPDEVVAQDYASGEFDAPGPRPQMQEVMPLYVSMRKPFVWDMSDEGAATTRKSLSAVGISRESVRGNSASLGNAKEREIFNRAVREQGYDGVIVRDEDGIQEIIAFRPEQIKSAIGNNGNFDPENPDIRYSARQADLPTFKRWANDAPLVTSVGAADYPFKSGAKVVLEAYHGTGRGDRVGEVFKRSRATSGPMAYFTSSPELASSYATGKADTSRSQEDDSYEAWFKYKPKGQRTAVDIARAWYSLDDKTKARVAERLPDIRTDDDNEVIYEAGGGDIGSYAWNLKLTQRGFDKQGNPLQAAVETWLTSGALFGAEQNFMQVLKLAGMPMSDIEFDSPNETFPFVYKTYVKMGSPLVTSDVPERVKDALRAAAKTDRSRAKSAGADAWDKNTTTLKQWVDGYLSPTSGDNTYAWTSIPDKVTEVFKGLGYDGIIDWSGKGGGHAHPVYIPFAETQVKSALGNNGKFDEGKMSIMRSERTAEGVDQPDVIIGSVLGMAKNQEDYAEAKGGDVQSALRLAKVLVNADLIEKVRILAGDKNPLIAPVVALEAGGRNKIPRAAAEVLAARLGLDTDQAIVQSNSPQRTGMDGIDRLFSSPEFSGDVFAGRHYILLDDTITQGGTFAALASHISARGGVVLGSVALTGKQYSAKIKPSVQTIGTLREQFSDIEFAFKAITGYGFDALTESEARYISNYKPANTVRDRIASAGRRASTRADSPAPGDVTQYSIRAGTSAWDGPQASRFDDFVYKAQDKMIDVKRVIESITKSVGQVADNLNVYLQEELFHGRAAKRTTDFGQQELQPLMEQIKRDGYTIGDVEEYLHARHAKEANAVIASREASMPDGGSGMTDAAAAAYLNGLSAKDAQQLNAIANQVDAILGKTRQMYADYGLESQQTVDGWGQMFQHYVPLQREDKEGSMGIGQGFSVKGKEVKGRTGSTRKVVDILANIALQRERLIVRGEKNRVSQALVGLALANPNPDFWTVGSPPRERVYDPKTNTVVERMDPMYKSRDNVLVAKLRGANGEVQEVAVNFSEDDPRALRMAKSMKNMDAAQLEGLLGVSAKITRYFSAINTQYNPIFGVVNLMRDVQGAIINLDNTALASKKGRIARDTISALSGIYQDMRAARQNKQPSSAWSALWDEFQAEGGQTGFRQMFETSQDRADELQSILTPYGWMDNKWGKIFTANGVLKAPMEKAQDGAAALFNWLSDYNESMENSVRLATYKAAKDQGMSREQAASLAKNLTVNFNRKGQVGQQAGAVYAFFNAAMQGTARIGQTLFTMDSGNLRSVRLSSTGKKVVYGGMLLGSLQALALAAAGFDDEDPPDFVRERSLIIPTGGKTYVTIPMPLGFNVIPGLGRMLTEFALSGFENPARRAIDVASMFAGAFNPIGNAGMSIQTIAPTAIDPLVALTENRDYTGKPIARTSSNKALPGHSQYKDTASTIGKLLAEGINWSTGGNAYVAGALSPTPDQIDYLIGQATGGVGREILKVQQTALAAVRGEEVPTYKVPLLGRFVGNAASQASQSGQFYGNVNRLNELETEVKGMRKDGKMQEAAILLRSRPDAYLIQQANVAERQLQRLRREKRELIEKGASRELIKAKELQATQVMMRLNQAMAKMKASA